MVLQAGPAQRLGYQGNLGGRLEEPRVEVVSVHIFELQGCGIEAWLVLIDVAYSMRSQVDLAILLVGQFILAS